MAANAFTLKEFQFCFNAANGLLAVLLSKLDILMVGDLGCVGLESHTYMHYVLAKCKPQPVL